MILGHLSVESQFPHRVHFDKDRYHQVREIIEWCLENIGEGGYMYYSNSSEPIWAVVTAFGKSSWFFKNNKDAVRFALRWV